MRAAAGALATARVSSAVAVPTAVSVLTAVVVLAFTAGLAEAPARTALSADVTPAPEPGAPWSAPVTLSPCPAGDAAQVVFPSDRPSHATGAGAIVWGDSARCPDGEGARVAVLDSQDEPLAPATPRTAAGQPIAPLGSLVASSAPHGQILIAGSAPGAAPDALMIQGAAAGPFAALEPTGGASAPIALATGYLGDVALAAPPAGSANHAGDRGTPGSGATEALAMHVERFFAHSFARNVSGRTTTTAPMRALTLAMDFRSEVLAVWQQGAALYARLVPNRGAARPIQRLASVGSHVQIAAVLSDDERGIVAWSEQRGDETSVYIDRSAPGVRFATPQLLGRFPDPDGLAAPAASPALVRLSSESVMLAWAGAGAGHWVVHTAPIDLNGVGDADTIVAPGTDALLAHLAAGPEGDAIVLWTEPSPTAAGPPDMARQAIFAARGFDDYGAHGMFGAPEQVAPPAPVSDATVAIDPDSDRAIAVWRGEADAIEYALRAVETVP
jgi:hypothetical protein